VVMLWSWTRRKSLLLTFLKPRGAVHRSEERIQAFIVTQTRVGAEIATRTSYHIRLMDVDTSSLWERSSALVYSLCLWCTGGARYPSAAMLTSDETNGSSAV
jgi:hypothetical protein